ncbi:MAG: DMT family transporter [Roseitalea porphyridii]|jgi:drug/metabolite transporter (DMT)-like permease|uniref:DMT family transporter n=1 Tax=Roseitalea porphyridii TaxID=1852022 RepID=UPI0032EBA5A1
MSKPAPGPVDYSLLITLSLIWGSAFLLSKIAVADFPPITITLVRQGLAALLLCGLVLALRRPLFRPTARDLVFMVICAATGTVIPFTAINWGVAVIDSGLAAILIGFMPLVVIVLAHLLTRDEKMTVPKIAGVALGLIGLAILFWPALRDGFGKDVWRQLAVLVAATAYGINALSVKQLVRHPPMVLMAYITALTLVILVPAAFGLERPFDATPSSQSVMALLALGVFPSALGALFMFAIIERQGASFFGQINLLVPLAGVFVGVLFAGERPGWNALAALVIIVSGVVVARLGKRRRREGALQPPA